MADTIERFDNWYFPRERERQPSIDMPDLGAMEGRDVVVYYGFKIETQKGTCVLLPSSAVFQPCPNPRGVTADEALLRAIEGSR